MYFQLNNAYLFSGAYMIFKMSHQITPGTMKTSFTGIRQTITKTPLTNDAYFSRTFVNTIDIPEIGRQLPDYKYNEIIDKSILASKNDNTEITIPYWINIYITRKKLINEEFEDHFVYWYYNQRGELIPSYAKCNISYNPQLQLPNGTQFIALLDSMWYHDLWKMVDYNVDNPNNKPIYNTEVSHSFQFIIINNPHIIDNNQEFWNVGGNDISFITINNIPINCVKNTDVENYHQEVDNHIIYLFPQFKNDTDFTTFIKTIVDCFNKGSGQTRYSVKIDNLDNLLS
jgi:hypothetical protein